MKELLEKKDVFQRERVLILLGDETSITKPVISDTTAPRRDINRRECAQGDARAARRDY